jgi:hypothetical protein
LISINKEVCKVHGKFKKEFETDAEKYKQGITSSKLHIFQEETDTKRNKCC